MPLESSQTLGHMLYLADEGEIQCRKEDMVGLTSPMGITSPQVTAGRYILDELIERDQRLLMQCWQIALNLEVYVLASWLTQHHLIPPCRNKASVWIPNEGHAQEVGGFKDLSLRLLVEVH